MNRRFIGLVVFGLALGWGHTGTCQGQPKTLTHYFGGEKIIVELDPTSDLPETAFPFDRNFIIRKYLPVEEGVLETATLGLILNPKDSVFSQRYALFNEGKDINGNTTVRLLNCVVRPSPGESKYAPTHASFDIFVPHILKPGQSFDIIYTKSMAKDTREALSRCFIAMYNSGGNLDARCIKTIDEINRIKALKHDPMKLYQSDFEAYYKQVVSGELRNDMILQLSEDSIVMKYSELLMRQPSIQINYSNKYIFLEYKVLANSSTTTPFTFESRANFLLQPDFGLVFYGLGGNGPIGTSPQFWGLMPYVGVNFLFRPFDGDIRLNQLPKGHVKNWQRLSLHGGLTLLTLAKDNQRKNLLGSFNPMVGMGFRFSTALKAVGGVIFYNKIRYDQIFDESRTQAIGYVGVSIDLRVRKYIGDIAKVFTPN